MLTLTPPSPPPHPTPYPPPHPGHIGEFAGIFSHWRDKQAAGNGEFEDFCMPSKISRGAEPRNNFSIFHY